MQICSGQRTLKPGTDNEGRPIVSFAPALILRKRTHVGMVRIYDALIERMRNGDDNDVPAGLGGLIDDEDDQEDVGTVRRDRIRSWAAPSGGCAHETLLSIAGEYISSAAVVEAINQRRGVLVQGPPGTGKSHTIANLIMPSAGHGQTVWNRQETGRALQVLKDKLPEELQPLCVSL